jgi:integrase/recombinase XerD
MTEKQESILNEYKSHIELKGFKVESVYRYILSIKEYFEYLQLNNIEYDKVSLKHAEDYRTYLVTTKTVSRGSINNALNRVRSFYRFLVLKSYCFKNPFSQLKGLFVGLSIPKNILAVSDMGKLLDNFSIKSDHDLMLKSIAEIMYGSGIRINEAVTLKLESIDFDKKTITITQSKSKETIKQRKVITNENAINVLKEYLKFSRKKLLKENELSEGFIYPQVKTGSFAVSLNHKLKNECERLRLKVITSHGFRHSVATHILRSGAGIKEVQEFLGHKKITNTEIYTHVLKDDLKKIVQKFHPRGEE